MDFDKDQLVGYNPCDISETDIIAEYAPAATLSTHRISTFHMSNTTATRKHSLPLYFYDMNQFCHQYSSYFLNQLRLDLYTYIRLRDELIDFNCYCNDSLYDIFINDLKFHDLQLPIQNKNKMLLLQF